MATTHTQYGVAGSDRPTQPYSFTVSGDRSNTEWRLEELRATSPDWEFVIVTRTIVTSDWEEVE